MRDGTEPPFGEVFPSRAFPAIDFMLGGLFIASDFAFFDGAVTIFPALRYDFYHLDPTDDPLLPTFAGAEQSDTRLSPKVGVTVKLGDDVVLYGNYAQGFRAPTPYQVNKFFENLTFGYTSLPNPDLGPERSESWEGGIRFTSDAVSLQITGFIADYDEFINHQVVGGSFTPTILRNFSSSISTRLKSEGSKPRQVCAWITASTAASRSHTRKAISSRRAKRRVRSTRSTRSIWSSVSAIASRPAGSVAS